MSRRPLASGLAIVLCAGLAWAGDDPVAEEAPPSPDEALAILGRGGDWEAMAEELLARLPAGDVQAAAQAALPVTDQPDLLIGAASWLGRPDAQGRRSEAPAKVLAARLARKGLDVPARAALLEALGAVALGPDLQGIAELARSGPREVAGPACLGLARSVEGATPLLDLAVALHAEAIVSSTPPPAPEEGEAPTEEGATEGATEAESPTPAPPPPDGPAPFEARHRLGVVLDALGRLAASPRGRLLVEALRHRDDVTLAVVRTLGRVKDEAGIAAVQELARTWAVEGASVELRVEGVRLLVATRLDEPEQFLALTRAEQPAVRAAVAGAVHELGLLALLPWLVDALEDPAPEVVTAAHRALCAIARREAPPIKQAWSLWLKQEAPRPAPQGSSDE